MKDLKEKAVRGGMARLFGQAAILVLRLGFTAIMARLLDPRDFGLVAMVSVVTGVYGLFSTAGLSLATIQRPTVTDEADFARCFGSTLLLERSSSYSARRVPQLSCHSITNLAFSWLP